MSTSSNLAPGSESVFIDIVSFWCFFVVVVEDIQNTVVDVGVAANGTYNWTLEFQCKRLDRRALSYPFCYVKVHISGLCMANMVNSLWLIWLFSFSDV